LVKLPTENSKTDPLTPFVKRVLDKRGSESMFEAYDLYKSQLIVVPEGFLASLESKQTHRLSQN